MLPQSLELLNPKTTQAIYPVISYLVKVLLPSFALARRVRPTFLSSIGSPRLPDNG